MYLVVKIQLNDAQMGISNRIQTRLSHYFTVC